MRAILSVLFLLLTQQVFAQSPKGIEFSLTLGADSITYTISARPTEATAISANTITASGQVTIVVPNGFEMENFENLSAKWDKGRTIVRHPKEDLDHDYISIGLVEDNNPRAVYKTGAQTALFSFECKNGCKGSLRLIDNEQDEFAQPDNSKNSNPGNELSVIDLGNGLIQIEYIRNTKQYIVDCSVD